MLTTSVLEVIAFTVTHAKQRGSTLLWSCTDE